MYKLEKQEKSIFTFIANATQEEFEKFMNEAYEKNKGRYNVQGFRKGHAPRKVIEQNYGAQVFVEDALSIFVNKEYAEILKGNSTIKPVSQPDITITKFDGKTVEAKIVVTGYPEVKLGAFTGLTIEGVKNTAKDEDVEAELKQLQERQARFVPVERQAKLNDFVVIDFVGRMDGKKFEGGSAEDYRLQLGSGAFVPGFEEQVEGMNIGEKRTIKIKFPENYVQNLQGKDAEFEVTLNKVEEKQLPELNDELASNVSEFETLADLKADIKKHLQESVDARNKQETENKLMDQIVANAEVDVPQVMIDDAINNHIAEVKNRLDYQGLTFEDYLKITNTTEEKFRADQVEPATKTTRTQLVIYALINELKLQATQQEVDAKIEEIAKKYQKSTEDYKKSITQNEINYIANDIIITKLMDYLVKNNTIN